MGVLAGIALAVLGVVGAALSRLLVDDLKAWLPRTVEELVKRAVRRLPEAHRERLSEEWGSYLNDVPGDLSKLFIALSLFYGAANVAREIETAVEEREAEILQMQQAIEKLEQGRLMLGRAFVLCDDLDSLRDQIEVQGLQQVEGLQHIAGRSAQQLADMSAVLRVFLCRRIASHHLTIQQLTNLAERCRGSKIPRPISEEHDFQRELDCLAVNLSAASAEFSTLPHAFLQASQLRE